jgi:hypothetical protein
MSQQHKSLLIRNRLRLVRELHPSQEFFAVMQSNYTLTATMIEEIESVKTVQGKVGKFLDILPRRGSEAFPTFIEALKETHQDQLAVLLDPTNTSPLPSSGGIISQPKESGIGQLTPSNVPIGIEQPKSKLDDTSSGKQLYQPSDSSPGNPPSSKGPVQQQQPSYESVPSRTVSVNISGWSDLDELTQCVITTRNESFIYNIFPIAEGEEPGKTPAFPALLRDGRCVICRNKKKNHGYEPNFDDVNLIETFKKFGIKVQSTIENKSREDILDRLSKETETDTNAFFLFVFAPGAGDLIVTDSGEFVSTFDIVDIVRKSEALKGKPKVVIFHLVDPGPLDHMDSVAEPGSGAPSLEFSALSLNATDDNLAILKVVPPSSDDLKIHWLVSSLIFLMTKHSKYYDLAQILDRVKVILEGQTYSVTLKRSLASGLYFTS